MKTFTPGGFAAQLARVAAELPVVEAVALNAAATVIEHAAKEEIGTYQRSAMGPFDEWAELAESTKADRVHQGFTENDPGLRTGEMRDSISHVVRGREAEIGSDDQNLVWFEMGTTKQPPRSVLGVAAHRNADRVVNLIGRAITSHIAGISK